MTSFFNSERQLLVAKRQNLSEEDFIAWFNGWEPRLRLKKACMVRQRFRCCYCKKFRDSANCLHWDLEHILCAEIYPQFYDADGNLAIACSRCNNAKTDKDVLDPRVDRPPEVLPSDPAEYTIPHPYLSDWDEHLEHDNYFLYEGRSAQGTNLISVCKLNYRVEEAAGVLEGTIDAAIVSKFFRLLPPASMGLVPEGQAAQIAKAAVVANEEVAIDLQIAKLQPILDRAARREERLAQNVH